MFQRKLTMDLPPRQSAFYMGARQTGKTYYLTHRFKNAIVYDLLNTHNLARLTKSPFILREEILALKKDQFQHPIIIDEIQKVPDLLNEIHWLIENTEAQFILCGSSARKLKIHSTNLLGGRAWSYHFYPLTFAEITDFDLLKALKQGLIPKHYLADSQHIQNHLEAYVEIYLTDEIRNEGLVRNLVGFSRFLDIAGLCNGEMINANNIARDCGVDRTTVQGYYQILVDTLLGYFIYPYRKKAKREIIAATPKFYLFDVGIANYLGRNIPQDLKGSIAGKSFEHYILMELLAFIELNRKRLDITYWRTKTGLEVDFIIGHADFAIEVKISEHVHQQDLKGLIAFGEEHPHTQAIVVSQDPRPRKIIINSTFSISVLPWRDFLKKLWAREII